MEISTIGLDLAKSVFQVHAVGKDGKAVIRKALRRSQDLPFFRKLAAGAGRDRAVRSCPVARRSDWEVSAEAAFSPARVPVPTGI
jgi:transposase